MLPNAVKLEVQISLRMPPHWLFFPPWDGLCSTTRECDAGKYFLERKCTDSQFHCSSKICPSIKRQRFKKN